MADQAVVSGTRFVFAVVLARYTAPSEFGAYVLAFSTLLFLNGIQTALITGPMMVLGAAREGDDFRRYVTALAIFQLAVAAGASLLALAIAGVMALTPAGPGLRGAFLGMSAAIFFVQTQEFVRRVLFTKRFANLVLVNDLLFCGLQLGGIATLWRLDGGGAAHWLSARNVFFVIAAAGTAATAFGLAQIARDLIAAAGSRLAYLKENWAFGKWELGTFTGIYLYGHGITFIAAAVIGASGAALLEAPRLLLGPVQLVIQASANIMIPRATKRFQHGGSNALYRFLRSAQALVACVCCGYCLMVALIPGYLLELLYSGNYAGSEGVLILWALFGAVNCLLLFPRTLLLVIRKPHILMYCNLSIGVIMFVVSFFLAVFHGVLGIVAGMILGRMVLLFLMGYCGSKCLGVIESKKTEGAIQDPNHANRKIC